MKLTITSLAVIALAASAQVSASVSMHHKRAGHAHTDLAKRLHPTAATPDAPAVDASGSPAVKKRNVKRSCPAKGKAAASGVANNAAAKAPSSSSSGSGGGSRFPELGFKMPAQPPTDLSNWWADPSTEYAFMGFSYEVTACQSLGQMQGEFKNIRNTYNGRYIRLYGACDRQGFYDDVASAAWDATLGVHALVWFGFDGGDIYKQRQQALLGSLKSNAKARAVTRVVQYGSEPLFDSVAGGTGGFVAALKDAKPQFAALGIPITVSDMAYGYQKDWPATGAVLDAIDMIDAHMLPFFGGGASTGGAAWGAVTSDTDFFLKNGGGKKIYFSENGWPSVQSSGVSRNNDYADASVGSEQGYFNLLDSQCAWFKSQAGGGIGWFFHIYSDSQEPGYGLLDSSGAPKFDFKPKTQC